MHIDILVKVNETGENIFVLFYLATNSMDVTASV